MTFEVQAHRANSAAAIEAYLRVGPDSLELDVGVLADRTIVVSHEVRATTLECPPGSPLLGTQWRDLAAEDARALGRLTLDDALALAGGTPLVVEAKVLPPATLPSRAFADALEPYLGRISLISFDADVLARARESVPTLSTTFLFAEPVPVAAGHTTVGPRADLVTRELVDGAHALGMRVVPWTVNEERAMRALIELGVDGIGTDEPPLLRSVLSARGAAP
jgi:glycerophosphoryl diester phosphodiesterase